VSQPYYDIQIQKLRPVARANQADVDSFFAGLPDDRARALLMDAVGDIGTAWFYSDLTRTMYLLLRTELFILCWTLEGITRELCPRIIDAMENMPPGTATDGTDLIALAVASLNRAALPGAPAKRGQ